VVGFAGWLVTEPRPGKPTLIIVDSIIGYGAPAKAGHHSAHGELLGAAELAGAKQFFGFPDDQSFVVPDAVHEHFAASSGARGADLRDEWNQLFAGYRVEFTPLADQLERMQRRQLPATGTPTLPVYAADEKGQAGRDTSGKVLNAIAARVPWLIGGSADLGPSNKSALTFDGAGDFSATSQPGGTCTFGVREHASGTIANGLAEDPRLPGRVSDLLRLSIRRAQIVGVDGAVRHPPLHLIPRPMPRHTSARSCPRPASARGFFLPT
jgi:transketolase